MIPGQAVRVTYCGSAPPHLHPPDRVGEFVKISGKPFLQILVRFRSGSRTFLERYAATTGRRVTSPEWRLVDIEIFLK